MRRPWRAHYTAKWALDPFVRSLKPDVRMVYLELLDIAWDENGLKQEWVSTGRHIAQRIGVSRRKFLAIWSEVRVKFVEYSPGIWSNLVLENERVRAELHSEKQSKNAKRLSRPPAMAEPDVFGLAQPLREREREEEEEEEREEKREGELFPSPENLRPEKKSPSKKSRKPSSPTASALEVLAAFNLARRRTVKGSRELSPTAENLAEIEARLLSGNTVADLLHVVAVAEQEVANGGDERYFNLSTPFRASNITRYLTRPAPASPKKAWKPPEDPVLLFGLVENEGADED